MQTNFPSGAAPIELGDEPPLVTFDDRNGPPSRREISLRWLTGTVLTGMTSIFLIGGALMAALEGRYTVQAAPTRASDTTTLSAGIGSVTKGNRATRSVAQFSNRQIIQVNTVTRDGERAHIRAKPYKFVTASLATRKSNTGAGRIPPFNPLKIFSDAELFPDRAGSDSIYSARVEGEVTLAIRAFPLDSPLLDDTLTSSEADIERYVRDSARFLSDGTVEVASLPVVDPARFDFGLAQQSEFSRLSVRISAENVSFVSKSEEDAPYAGMEEKIVPVREDMTFEQILVDNGASEDEAADIIDTFASAYSINLLKTGQRVRLAYAPAEDDSGRMRPERVSLYSETTHEATVALSDSGKFVSAAAPAKLLPDAFAEADRLGYAGPTPTLYDSVYQTALENEISEPLIQDLVRIFSFDVDYNARVKPGDSLEVVYALDDTKEDEATEILFTALKTGGAQRRFYRFRTPDDGLVDFYDESGKSAKKFLMRKPLSGGRYSSGFGMRRHPVVGTVRKHTGVDWAAKRGTPIMASGNGVIEDAKWNSGYGRWVKIRHANGYETAYGHMSGFARGIKKGVRIRQGQIIGYVGSTGLSTGPHLHYEVLVNERFVDPMRIRLPRGRVLDGELLAAFERERDRIDTLLERGRTPSRIAAR